MSDVRKEGVNLLNPELGREEMEGSYEDQESGQDFAVPHGERARVDQTHLANVKSTIASQIESSAMPEKDPILAEIENILAENMNEIYAQLPESKREAFKAEGERVATSIRIMIMSAKIKVHKVLKLITGWLRMIPGVNVYFLKQEAKIKLDKLLDYAEARRNSNSL